MAYEYGRAVHPAGVAGSVCPGESSTDHFGSTSPEFLHVMSGQPTRLAYGLPQRGPLPESVVERLPVRVMVSTISDDRIILVSREFTAAYGHETHSVSGRAAAHLHVESDRENTLGAAAARGDASVEVRILSSDGRWCRAKAQVSRFLLDGKDDVLLTTFHDLGDRKEVEARVAELARIPDLNPGPVLRLDLDGTIRMCNKAAAATLGADLVGRCLWDVCPDLTEDARGRVLEGGDPVVEDASVGETWLRWTLTRPADADQVFAFGTDVTSQKLVERELEERARFPAMNPGAVARLSDDGTVIRANPAASGLFELEDIRGLCWLDLSPGLDEATWERARSHGGVVQYEAAIGGRDYSFVLRHEPVGDQVFVYGSDITELKAAERALAELARFPDMNPGPVCRLDRSGRILLANRAARALFQCEVLDGRSWLELVPDVDGDVWNQVVSGGEELTVETTLGGRHYVLTHAPGPEGMFVFVYGSDVTRQKEAERALMQSEKMATLGTLAAGVTHELNNPAAAARRAAQQLEESLSALRGAGESLAEGRTHLDVAQLVAELDVRARAAAAHRCELTSMERGDLESVIEDWLDGRQGGPAWEIAPILVEGGFDIQSLEELAHRVGVDRVGSVAGWLARAQQVYQLLGEIQQGTARVIEIVAAMKSYSYLGQAPIQDVDVNEGIRSTLVVLRSRLGEGITVHTELTPDLPRIEAFGGELNQVWTNLVDNAVDATAGTGSIWIRTNFENGLVVVEVEDDGPGIASEIQSRVFDAFFTTKPPGMGTGLGLNSAYKVVVDQHQGAIRLDSRPGKTRFRVELPLRRTHSEAGSRTGSPGPGRPGD